MKLAGRNKADAVRFKGFGEMLPAQLKETAMNLRKRLFLRISLEKAQCAARAKTIEQLMRNKPEERIKSKSEAPEFVSEGRGMFNRNMSFLGQSVVLHGRVRDDFGCNVYSDFPSSIEYRFGFGQ